MSEEQESQGKSIAAKLLNKLKERRKERLENQNTRAQLITVYKALDAKVNSDPSRYFGEKGVPYLPENLGVTLLTGEELVSIARPLRAEQIYSERSKDDTPKHENEVLRQRFIHQNYDTIAIPRNWVTDHEDQFVAVFVPKYGPAYLMDGDEAVAERLGNEGYDITVLKVLPGEKLAKLTSRDEAYFRKHHVAITGDNQLKDAPLSCPRKMPDGFHDLVEIEAAAIEQDNMVPVYSGDLARRRLSLEDEKILTPDDLERHYKMTINGSACFLFQVGSAERRKNPTLRPEVTQEPITVGVEI